MSKRLLGIDLGGTTTKFAVVTTGGKVEQKWTIPTDISDEGTKVIPDIITSLTNKFTSDRLTCNDFYGIGMGTPGSVDRINGTVTGAYNLNWATKQTIKQQIEQKLGLSLFLENDANVAALGERWQGAGENQPDIVFITLGTGVGGGIIANGNLLHGVNGCAGEIGHITVDPAGFECTCGKRGCLETVSSATGIVRLALELSSQFIGESQLQQFIMTGKDVSSKDIFTWAQLGDAFAQKVVDRVCFFLGLAIGNISNTLNPAHIVIGGGVSAAGDFLIQQVRNYFELFTFPEVRNSTKICLAQLGNDAGVIGAASLALVLSEK